MKSAIPRSYSSKTNIAVCSVPNQQKDRFIFIMEIAIYLKVCMIVGNKRSTASILVPLLVGFWVFVQCAQVCAVESKTASIVEKGRLEATGVGGAAVIDREYHFYMDGALRVGVGAGFEIASPFALTVRLIGSRLGGVTLGLGIVDWYVSSEGGLLFEPSVMIAGYAHLGPEASFRAAVDVVGAEEGIQRGDHAFWLRGSAGAIFDLGNIATLAFGLSYQRILVDGAHPDELGKIGWASDSRISLGSVRTQSAYDLPLLSIHLQKALDLIIITRVDINADEGTSDVRCLAGFSVVLVPNVGP
jgi:hypothetical protein